MRVLVTGGTGFVGQPIIKELLENGHDITVISRTENKVQINNKITFLNADLSSPCTYQKSLNEIKPEIVIHLSWSNIPEFTFANCLQNLNDSIIFLEYVVSLKCCRKILISGSCFELNKNTGVCYETEFGFPKDNFAWSKHAILSWALFASKKYKITIAWMRIFYVYGPNQRSGALIPTLLRHLSKNGALPDLRTPNDSNDFIYVGDVANAFSSAVEKNIISGIYNLGSGVSTLILDICRIAEKLVLGTDKNTIKLEKNTFHIKSDTNFWANCNNSRTRLLWNAKTNLKEGIEKTFNYLK